MLSFKNIRLYINSIKSINISNGLFPIREGTVPTSSTRPQDDACNRHHPPQSLLREETNLPHDSAIIMSLKVEI